MNTCRPNRTFIILIILASVFASPSAFARAGSGMNMGSRGTHTFQPSSSSAKPIQRTTTPQSNTAPAAQPTPAAPMGGSRSFLSGIAGGSLGASLAHMLFGGMGAGGGGILPLLLMGAALYYGMKMFRARGNIKNGLQNMVMQMPANNGAVPPIVESNPIALNENDLAAFRQLLLDIQHAWSEEDFKRLRQYVTPEMLNYFNEQLSANTSRGLSNKLENITVLKMETVESWIEYDLNYATVVIQWQASDYMVRIDRQPTDIDYVASGDPKATEIIEEQWTFSRVENGRWLLSAIQQM